MLANPPYFEGSGVEGRRFSGAFEHERAMFPSMPGRLLLERLLPITILVVAVVAVPSLIFSPSGLRRLDALRNEQREVDDQASRLAKEIRRLRAEVSQVRDHLPAIERVARDELGLLRKTEVVFQFDQ